MNNDNTTCISSTCVKGQPAGIMVISIVFLWDWASLFLNMYPKLSLFCMTVCTTGVWYVPCEKAHVWVLSRQAAWDRGDRFSPDFSRLSHLSWRNTTIVPARQASSAWPASSYVARLARTIPVFCQLSGLTRLKSGLKRLPRSTYLQP